MWQSNRRDNYLLVVIILVFSRYRHSGEKTLLTQQHIDIWALMIAIVTFRPPCNDCNNDVKWLQDPDCSVCYCGWCGQSAELVSCKSCKLLFCTHCIKRNLGEEFLAKIQASCWDCCSCYPGILQKLTMELREAVKSKGVASSSDSDSDSETSDSELEDTGIRCISVFFTSTRYWKCVHWLTFIFNDTNIIIK